MTTGEHKEAVGGQGMDREGDSGGPPMLAAGATMDLRPAEPDGDMGQDWYEVGRV